MRNYVAVSTGAAMLLLASATGRAEQPARGVTLTAIPTTLKSFAVAVGQRLQRPGKERITGTGSLYWVTNGAAQTAPVVVVWEIPLKIRIDGAGPPIIMNWGQSNAPGQAAKDHSDAVESMLDDTVDGLIFLNMQAGASRLLGKGFRPKGAGPATPGFDVVQLFYSSPLRNGGRAIKLYWFDSKTGLLDRVTYKSAAGATVEVHARNWQTVNGEAIPFLIERLENGQVTVRLTLTSATVGGGAQDGVFGAN